MGAERWQEAGRLRMGTDLRGASISFLLPEGPLGPRTRESQLHNHLRRKREELPWSSVVYTQGEYAGCESTLSQCDSDSVLGVYNRNDASGRLYSARLREERGFFDTFPTRRKSCRFGNERIKEAIAEAELEDCGDERKSFRPSTPQTCRMPRSSEIYQVAGSGIYDAESRNRGELLEYATKQRGFEPKVDIREPSEANVGRDAIRVLWDVPTPKDQIVFGEKAMEVNAHSWFCLHQRRATRDQECRLGCGRLSMILSMRCWGIESIASGGRRERMRV